MTMREAETLQHPFMSLHHGSEQRTAAEFVEKTKLEQARQNGAAERRRAEKGEFLIEIQVKIMKV